MEEVVYNLEDIASLKLQGSNKKFIINVKPFSNVSISELLSFDNEVILNISESAKVKYNVISLSNITVKRTIKVGENASLYIESIMLDKVVDDTFISIENEGGYVDYKNLCILNGGEQTLNTKITHKASNTKSQINNIGVSFDNANILFNTTGEVLNGFKKCDCRQLSKGIIIGEKSKITSRPILLIDEFDVQAYHGATIGKMSDDELFYLMSRGLSKKESFLLILNGLIEPFLNNISDDLLKNDIKNNISSLIGE